MIDESQNFSKDYGIPDRPTHPAPIALPAHRRHISAPAPVQKLPTCSTPQKVNDKTDSKKIYSTFLIPHKRHASNSSETPSGGSSPKGDSSEKKEPNVYIKSLLTNRFGVKKEKMDSIETICDDIGEEGESAPESPMTERKSKPRSRKLPPKVIKFSDLDPKTNLFGTGKFNIEPPSEFFEEPKLMMTRDNYEKDFYKKEHYNFIGDRDGECICVVSVQEELVEETRTGSVITGDGFYRGLITDNKGTARLEVPKKAFDKGVLNPPLKTHKVLNSKQSEISFYRVDDPFFTKSIRYIEMNLPQHMKHFTVGVVYALPGQTSLREICQNKPSPSNAFWDLLRGISTQLPAIWYTGTKSHPLRMSDKGYPLTLHTTEWHSIKIDLHVAPHHSTKQIFPLMLSDMASIIYYDSEDLDAFDPSVVEALHYIFIVVRPAGQEIDREGDRSDEEDIVQRFRVTFFNKEFSKERHHINPASPPADCTFTVEQLKEMIYTKIYNGLMIIRRTVPSKYLEDRAQAIKRLGIDFPKRKRQLPSTLSPRKKKSSVARKRGNTTARPLLSETEVILPRPSQADSISARPSLIDSEVISTNHDIISVPKRKKTSRMNSDVAGTVTIKSMELDVDFKKFKEKEDKSESEGSCESVGNKKYGFQRKSDRNVTRMSPSMQKMTLNDLEVKPKKLGGEEEPNLNQLFAQSSPNMASSGTKKEEYSPYPGAKRGARRAKTKRSEARDILLPKSLSKSNIEGTNAKIQENNAEVQTDRLQSPESPTLKVSDEKEKEAPLRSSKKKMISVSSVEGTPIKLEKPPTQSVLPENITFMDNMDIQFIFEPHAEVLEGSPKLTWVDDKIFLEEFADKKRTDFIGRKLKEEEKKSGKYESDVFCIAMVCWTPEVVSSVPRIVKHKALFIDEVGSYRYDLSNLLLGKDYVSNFSREVEGALGALTDGKYAFSRIDKKYSSVVADKVKEFENMNTKRFHSFKVAVLYSSEGQTNLTEEVFKNKPPQHSSFWDFMDSIGHKISLDGWKGYRGDFGHSETCDTYYNEWKDLKIMFHVCPMLNEEQIRRLIGNDICFIIYYDSPEYFDPNIVLNNVGAIPQVFSVVHPGSTPLSYHVASFNRYRIKQYPPVPPPFKQPIHGNSLKTFLFTKLHNGLLSAMNSPPLDKLYTHPRRSHFIQMGKIFASLEKSDYPKELRKLENHSLVTQDERDELNVGIEGNEPQEHIEAKEDKGENPKFKIEKPTLSDTDIVTMDAENEGTPKGSKTEKIRKKARRSTRSDRSDPEERTERRFSDKTQEREREKRRSVIPEGVAVRRTSEKTPERPARHSEQRRVSKKRRERPVKARTDPDKARTDSDTPDKEDIQIVKLSLQ